MTPALDLTTFASLVYFVVRENTLHGNTHLCWGLPWQPLQHHVELKEMISCEIFQRNSPQLLVEPLSAEENGIIAPVGLT